jgi:hypothetical protein
MQEVVLDDVRLGFVTGSCKTTVVADHADGGFISGRKSVSSMV